MDHMEYNRGDSQAGGLGMGGGDADNSALMRRTTAPRGRPVVRHRRSESLVVEHSSLMTFESGQDEGDSPTSSCPESEVEIGATSSASSTSPGKPPDHGRPNQLVRFCLRLAYNSLYYPYEMAKVLIQLGHEPIPGRPFHLPLLHRRPRLFLPGVHQYVLHIQRMDGYLGLYRGLTARLAASTVDYLLGDLVLAFLHFHPYKRAPREEPSLKEFWWNFARDSLRLATAVLLTQPFYVVMVRQIAQFVGKERIYEGIMASLMTLIKQEGYAGLFAGILPRLLGEWSVLTITSLLTHLCLRLIPMSRSQQQYNSVIIQMVASLLVYPMEVTSACMAGTGAPLAACEPPRMPLYNHWADCLTDLYARGGHNRGAILFWRTVPRIQLLRNKDGYLVRSG
ncbi:mitochondrial carrier homolog 2 [Drosophila subpulchrella]|uniref:mitochondrial carrier homolog 2 n=1 Tax=Drosophila subpulchrella TaxID=1486046 RepID=UPI0018A1B00D|nr:mitochondrial carrier homolog 2 [Drosophila subpulchrella]